MSDRELMQQALEALESLLPPIDDPNHDGYDSRDVRKWRTWTRQLRARLAEPDAPASDLFRVNMLRLCPALTHEQIDLLAEQARSVVIDTLTKEG